MELKKSDLPFRRLLHSCLLLLAIIFLVSCGNGNTASPTSSPPLVDKKAASELYQTGTILERKREFADALTAYNNALEHDPDYTDCLVARGRLYLQLRDSKHAITDLSRAAKLPDAEKHLLSIHYMLAEAQLQLGALSDARIHIDKFYALPGADTSRYNEDALKLKNILKVRN